MSTPNRFLLPDVPRVHFYDGGEQSPEDVPFPSCLAACMRYLGEEYPWIVKEQHGKVSRDNYANIYILAHSGMAFGLRWRDGWHMDNGDNMLVADPSEVIRRAFAAVGYTYEIVHKTGAPGDEALYKRKIKEALHRGRPILAFGIIGPPECCLITGYDEDGDVLLGWNFFQSIPPWGTSVAVEPTGHFRKGDWFSDTWSIIVIGEKVGRPEIHELNRSTLGFALQVARTPHMFDHHNGHAAYSAWAAQISDDAAFAGHDEATLRERHDVHNNVVGMLAECRWWAAQWVRFIAPAEPAMSEHLLAAAALFEKEHDLMWKIWNAVGGNGHPDAWRPFSRPEVRRQIAGWIREAQEHDVNAIAHLEQAL
ncbi:MAG TPA: hypothetical protein VD969_09530 [Symbiobacteriaceae bacterium]|nr:hypothetical protein [Symbiobacteriaceae bacterium]